MRISLGQRAHDAHPVTTECSWPQFVEWICAHQRTTGDKDGPYVCLAEFTPHAPGHVHPKNGPACPSTDPYRSLSALVASCGIPLDFDKGTVGPADIARVLTGLAYVAYTTHGHTDAAQRWRVFVHTAAPMDAATHKATWATLQAAFGGQADTAASDASRLSYLPGACVDPTAARCFHSDGALLTPTQAAPLAPVVTERGDGPVPGWVGPTDDATLLTIARNTRLKMGERFGGPIHFDMLWRADSEWLAKNFPPSTDDFGKGRHWNYTQADAALANELMFFTGGDTERAASLMRRSGIARDHDDDWSNRKVYAALALAMKDRDADQFHFMRSPVAPTDAELKAACDETMAGATVAVDGVPVGTTGALNAAIANIPESMPGGSSMNDYYAYMPDHTYIHKPSGERFSSASVDEAIGKDARIILVPTVPVHKYTWAPGKGDRFTLSDLDDTYVDGERVWLYNSYRAPKPHTQIGDPSRWLELVRRLYPEDAEHLISYFADAVQHPGRKCNHAIVLGSGIHGIGKDTLLAPVAYAVGRNNFRSIKPTALASEFNPWVMSVMVQISESHDLGEGQRGLSRFEFYERCKDLAAAPPASIDCRPLYQNPFPIANVLRLVLTTNHQVDGLHIDPKDRRHYCAWSDAIAMTEAESKAIWEWYDTQGGLAHVAQYLATLDLGARNWNPAAPPLRTAWWHQLVSGATSTEEDKFSDALDKLARPDWVTLAMVEGTGDGDLTNWIRHPANRRKLEREMVKSGYQRLPNPHEPKRGRWPINGAQVVVYRRSDVPATTLLRATP